MKRLAWIGIVTFSLFLIACGGGGGPDPVESNHAIVTSVSGPLYEQAIAMGWSTAIQSAIIELNSYTEVSEAYLDTNGGLINITWKSGRESHILLDLLNLPTVANPLSQNFSINTILKYNDNIPDNNHAIFVNPLSVFPAREKAAIFSPFKNELNINYDTLISQLESIGYQVSLYYNENATVSAMDTIAGSGYGVIIIHTHGSAWTSKKSGLSYGIIATASGCNSDSWQNEDGTYCDTLIGQSDETVFLSNIFFAKNSYDYEDAFIFLNSCKSIKNTALANSFLYNNNTGAAIVFGWTETVYTELTNRTLEKTVEMSIVPGSDLESIYNSLIADPELQSFERTGFWIWDKDSYKIQSLAFRKNIFTASSESISLYDKNADTDGDSYSPLEGDCNDADNSIRPFLTDDCDDGIDVNCTGSDLKCEYSSNAFSRLYSINQDLEFNIIKPAYDNGYFIVGVGSNSSGKDSIHVYRLTPEGSIDWHRIIKANGTARVNDATIGGSFSNSELFIVGVMQKSTNVLQPFYPFALKLNAFGGVLAHQVYEYPGGTFNAISYRLPHGILVSGSAGLYDGILNGFIDPNNLELSFVGTSDYGQSAIFFDSVKRDGGAFLLGYMWPDLADTSVSSEMIIGYFSELCAGNCMSLYKIGGAGWDGIVENESALYNGNSVVFLARVMNKVSSGSKSDIYIAEFDFVTNSIVRQKIIGTTNDDAIASLINTDDGNYLIASYDNDLGNPVLYKVDPNFDILWAREYNGNNLERIHSIVKSDGGYLAVGSAIKPDSSKKYGYLLKIRDDGFDNCSASTTPAFSSTFPAFISQSIASIANTFSYTAEQSTIEPILDHLPTDVLNNCAQGSTSSDPASIWIYALTGSAGLSVQSGAPSLSQVVPVLAYEDGAEGVSIKFVVDWSDGTIQDDPWRAAGDGGVAYNHQYQDPGTYVVEVDLVQEGFGIIDSKSIDMNIIY